MRANTSPNAYITSLLAAATFCGMLMGGCHGGPEGQSLVRAVNKLQRYTSTAAGFDTHSYYYDTGKEVVVIDAQFTAELAEDLIAKIRRTTNSPIRYLVITHPNPDKFNGASAFRAIGAKVISSAATAAAIPSVHAYKRAFFVDSAKMFKSGTYPKEAKVDEIFSGKMTLALEDNPVIELIELNNAGVSSTQTVVHIPAIKALIVGDLIHHGVHAWLEGGIVDGKPQPDLDAWKRALGELLTFSGTIVYGGRGDSAPVREAVVAQRSYLDAIKKLVTRYVADLGDRRSELFDSHAGGHHKAIAKAAGAAFPQRELVYLVEYGVYGLAVSLAQ